MGDLFAYQKRAIIIGCIFTVFVVWFLHEAKKPECAKTGCSREVENKGDYCEDHINKKPVYSGKNKCLLCDDKRVGTYYCEFHSKMYGYSPMKETKPSTSTSTYSYSNTTNKKDSSSSMPDCDDYEDIDEFLDDWEGNMPDGSDAEDYWFDW